MSNLIDIGFHPEAGNERQAAARLRDLARRIEAGEHLSVAYFFVLDPGVGDGATQRGCRALVNDGATAEDLAMGACMLRDMAECMDTWRRDIRPIVREEGDE